MCDNIKYPIMPDFIRYLDILDTYIHPSMANILDIQTWLIYILTGLIMLDMQTYLILFQSLESLLIFNISICLTLLYIMTCLIFFDIQHA